MPKVANIDALEWEERYYAIAIRTSAVAALAIAATSVAVFGHAVWVANLLTLPADIFHPREVGTAAGFSGMGGAIGGALANLATGIIVARFSFLPIFIWAGLILGPGAFGLTTLKDYFPF